MESSAIVNKANVEREKILLIINTEFDAKINITNPDQMKALLKLMEYNKTLTL